MGRARRIVSALGTILASMGEAHPPCLLCGNKSSMTGVFIPADSRLWGAPAGRDRMVLYALCDGCFTRPDQTDACEQRISDSLLGVPS